MAKLISLKVKPQRHTLKKVYQILPKSQVITQDYLDNQLEQLKKIVESRKSNKAMIKDHIDKLNTYEDEAHIRGQNNFNLDLVTESIAIIIRFYLTKEKEINAISKISMAITKNILASKQEININEHDISFNSLVGVKFFTNHEQQTTLKSKYSFIIKLLNKEDIFCVKDVSIPQVEFKILEQKLNLKIKFELLEKAIRKAIRLNDAKEKC